MAAKIPINLEANTRINIMKGDVTELNNMAKNMAKIGQDPKMAKGIGTKRIEETKKLQVEIEKLSKKAAEAIKSGMAKTDPDQFLQIQKELNGAKDRYYKITNQITGSYLRNLNLTKEQKDEWDEVTRYAGKLRASIDKDTQAMEELKEETKAFEKARDAAAKKTGVDSKKLSTIADIDKEIKARQRANGAAKSGEKENIIFLKKAKQELLAIDGKTEEWAAEIARIEDRLLKNNAALAETRSLKANIMVTAVDTALQEGKINKEQAKFLKGLVEEKTLRDANVDLAKEERSVEATTSAKTAVTNAKKVEDQNKKTAGSFLKKVSAATLYYAALRTVRRVVNSVISTIKELDKALTEVAMVTDMSREKAWELVSSYQALAFEIGITTHEIAKLSVYFFRQGRAAADALELTRVAATAAKVAAIDVMDSANYLTSAINGFGLAADQAMAVSDKFAALGASSASSYEEMAIALSKVAPSANVAGVSMDFMMGILAKGIETTREAPENIGTAFKTVFARMTQIKDFGATLEEGVSVNAVEEALKEANVALRNSEGEFRTMDNVLQELGGTWDTLDRNQQAYIATALAGTRQQSRLLAVMQNFDRTMELVEISSNSAGATLAQHAEYAGGMEASLAKLNNAWEKMILVFSDSDEVINIIDKITNAVASFADAVERDAPLIKGIIVASLIAIGIGLIALKVHLNNVTMAAAKTAVALNLATFGIPALIAGVVALGAAIYAFFKKRETEEEKAIKRQKELTEAVRENRVELYNYTKQGYDLGTMADRYEELKDKVVKTKDEIAEMSDLESDLTAKLDELSGEYDITITGDIDEDILTTIKFFNDQKREAQKEQIALGQDQLDAYDSTQTYSAENMDAMYISLADSLFGNEFLDATDEDQKTMLKIIEANFDSYMILFEKFRDYNTDMLEESRELYESASFTGEMISIGLEKTGEKAFDAMVDKFGTLGMDQDEFYKVVNDKLMEVYGTGIKDASVGQISGAMQYVLQDLPTSRAFEMQGEVFSDEMIGIVQGIQDVIDGEIAGDDETIVWSDLLSMSDEDIMIILQSIDDFAPLLGLGVDNLRSIIEGGFDNLDITQTVGIGQILDSAGFDADTIGAIINDIEQSGGFTIDNIRAVSAEYGLDTSTQSGLLDVMGSGATVKSVVDNFRQISSGMQNTIELQEKYNNNTITGTELEEMKASLSAENYQKFLNNELTYADLQEQAIADQKAELENLIAISKARMEMYIPGTTEYNQAYNDLITYTDLLENLDYAMFEPGEAMDEIINTIADTYNTQIEYVKQLNEEKQRELDLIQQKIDMNKSMLTLERQMAALSKDTSYGAQATLRGLEEQAQADALEREKFVMDLITEQQVAELTAERDQHISNLDTNVDLLTTHITGGGAGGVVTDRTFSSTIGKDITFSVLA